MVIWQTQCRWETGMSADSVEWCPVEPYRDVLACGTYQLHRGAPEQDKPDQEKNKQTRLGKIFVFIVKEDVVELSPVHAVQTAGVLDQKWSYHEVGGHPALAVATSLGTVQLYHLIQEQGTLQLKLWTEHLIGEDVLALSLDWSTNKTASNEPRLVVSDSSGAVTILRVGNEGLEEMDKWKTHGFEAWIAAFNYWNPDVFYSGGDDCLLKVYDARMSGAAALTNRSHEAGVTTARHHTDDEHLLLSGSYDENIRSWDTRQMKSCVWQVNVGGGVWRLKWQPSGGEVAVAAAMYGGARALRRERLLARYHEHASITYGADWNHHNSLIATCSFYDCSLHISQLVESE